MQPNSRIVLLVCDPTALYVYWELDPSLKRRVAAGAVPGPVVRLHDLDAERGREDAEAVYLDYACAGQQGDGVLAQVQPDRSYEAELGYSQDGGEWCSVARSNRAQSPPRAPSDWAEDHFVTVPWDADLSAFTAPLSLLSRECVAVVDVAPGWTRQPHLTELSTLAADAERRPTSAAESDPVAERPPISAADAEPIAERRSSPEEIRRSIADSAQKEAVAATEAPVPATAGETSEEQAGRAQTVQSWPGNAGIRRAALPFGGAEPLAGPPAEMPAAGPPPGMPVAAAASDGATGDDQRPMGVDLSAAAQEQRLAGGASPAPVAARAVGATLRLVEPLPRYGVVAPGGSPVVSYSSSPSSSAVSSSEPAAEVPVAQSSSASRSHHAPDERRGSDG